MTSFQITTRIAADAEVCFDLARDIDFHTRSLAHTGERAVAGRIHGHIGLGESVTWEARHLGFRQRLTVVIRDADRPGYFRDEMTQGPFRAFAHDHHFTQRGGITVMVDDVTFASPWGPLGRLVDRLFLTRYMRRLIATRAVGLKAQAERSGCTGRQSG